MESLVRSLWVDSLMSFWQIKFFPARKKYNVRVCANAWEVSDNCNIYVRISQSARPLSRLLLTIPGRYLCLTLESICNHLKIQLFTISMSVAKKNILVKSKNKWLRLFTYSISVKQSPKGLSTMTDLLGAHRKAASLKNKNKSPTRDSNPQPWD